MEILMACVDFIPVILCFIAMFKLQKMLYHQMSKYSFAMFAAGTIMILFAGSCKAIWKLLYYAANVDWRVLNDLMFPVQGFGFALAFAGLVIMFIDMSAEKKEKVLVSILPLFLLLEAVPEVYAGKTLWLICQIVGTFGIFGTISFLAFKKNKPLYGIFMIVASICYVLMAKFSKSTTNADGTPNVLMNWIAEGTNIAAQVLFVFSVYGLDKAGLNDIKSLIKKK